MCPTGLIPPSWRSLFHVLLCLRDPGMCMTLAMTLGMSLGCAVPLHMMWGELIGVGLVSRALRGRGGGGHAQLSGPLLGVPVRGGAYLVWLGIQMWQAKGKMAIPADLSAEQETRRSGWRCRGSSPPSPIPRLGLHGLPATPSSARPSPWHPR